MNEQLIQLYGYLHGMWRYRWSALLVAWIVALIGWVIVLALPNQYSARAVVYADTSSVMKPLLKGLAPETNADDELDVMSRVLLSRNNLLSVIRKTDMDLGVTTAKQKEDLVRSLAAAIVVKGGASKKSWGRRSNIYEISYTSTSPQQVYQVVSNLLNTMIEDTLNSSRTDTVSAQKFLNNQLNKYGQRLSLAEQKLAEFKKINIGFMPDEKGGYYSRMQRAQDKVQSTGSDLKLARQRYLELKKQINGENPMLDSGAYQSVYLLKLKKYQNQLANLRDQYTEQYPDVVAMNAKIEELKAGRSALQPDSANDNAMAEFNPVYQEIKMALSKASVEVQILKTKLVDQKNYVKKLKGSIDLIPEVEAKLAKLTRNYEVTKVRYSALAERLESARLAQSAGQSTSDVTFRIIEPPVVPLEPSGPKRLLLLAVVLLLALGAGLGWGFLRFILQPTFFNLKQLAKVTGLPLLGTVSLYVSTTHKRSRRFQLLSFLSVTCLLAVVCAGVLFYNYEGTELIRTLLKNMGKAV